VECGAYIDFKFYRQGPRVIVHLINGNHTGFDHGYAEKNIPVGPVKVRLNLPGFSPRGARATEDGQRVGMGREGEALVLTLDELREHQLLIVE
jgi:hypothetical protein